ncbi:HD domain-containing protein [Micromonospora orduensis]|uniref:HD domain-containing protein n=1 Tax=Micromonospora orduensis TaxID=1420891 RepID=UPI003642F88F
MTDTRPTYLAHVHTSTPLVEKALDYAFQELADDASGHDRHHVLRVYKMAQRLAKAESLDLEIVELIAALHDIQDFKFTGDEMSGAREAERWLLEQNAPPDLASLVASNVAGISFKGAGTPTNPLTSEGMCVQDADRLDAMGAIGIARCFTYGGARARAIHDPEVAVAHHSTTEQYLKHQGTSINHFHEKLLLLKDRMNTEAAKRMAEDRHDFMESYLRRFSEEWEAQS